MKISDFDSLKKGDCFSININSKKLVEYQNTQLILIVMDKFIDNNNHKKVIVGFKLIPKNIKEENFYDTLLKSEFVKIKIVWMEERFFPFEGSRSYEEHINYIKAKECVPNEYGMLFDYNYVMIVNHDNEKVSNKIKYIGNYKIDYPENSYYKSGNININSKFNFISDISVNSLVNSVIESYEDYNLKKSKYFDMEKAKAERQFWITQLNITRCVDLRMQELKKARGFDNDEK